ncbi:MAG: tetratricopeptide repeat protein [Thioalkalispiraceae bacterium]|jgi:tetratricopeptide (TPR) repeat protein
MLNKFTKTGWLFLLVFAILSYGCTSSPVDNSGSSTIINDDKRPPRYNYAIELMKREDYDKASEVFLALEPEYTHPDLYTNMAIIYLHKAKLDTAKEYIEKSISIRPGNYQSQNIHGVILRKIGKFDEAIAAYNTSIANNGKYPDAYLNIAILYDIYLNNANKALPYYEKYKQLAGNDQNIDKWIVEVTRRAK